jgi:mRNA-degrading endonuclease RelE of RelBE toxin-antitoxin system
MEFIEASAFTRRISDYLADDQYRKLQIALANNPDLDDVMPGTGGFRKLRWADSRRGKGRRGGLRIIYYYFSSNQQVWLMTLYDKDEARDLTPKEKTALQNAIEGELKAREGKRAARERRFGRIR